VYADAQRLRADALALARAGSELSGQAGALLASAGSTRWQSSAADAMRRRLAGEAGMLHEVAAGFADAGSALSRHAAAVEALQSQIRAVEQRAHALVQSALHLCAVGSSALASALPGGEDLLRRLRTVLSRLPPPGHPDWLEVPDQLRRLGIPGAR